MKSQLSRETITNKLKEVDFNQPLSFINIRNKVIINGKK